MNYEDKEWLAFWDEMHPHVIAAIRLEQKRRLEEAEHQWFNSELEDIKTKMNALWRAERRRFKEDFEQMKEDYFQVSEVIETVYVEKESEPKSEEPEDVEGEWVKVEPEEKWWEHRKNQYYSVVATLVFVICILFGLIVSQF